MLIKMDCIDVCFPKSCKSSGLIGKQTQVGGSSFFRLISAIFGTQVKNTCSNNVLQQKTLTFLFVDVPLSDVVSVNAGVFI